MYLCIDVHYVKNRAKAAAVAFRNVSSAGIEKEYIIETGPVGKYIAGEFYKRELPIILELLPAVEYSLKAILVDGYVWLSAGRQPGLGAHLFKALDEKIPIIGVAKSAYRDTSMAVEVYKGRSRKPLYVTAVGMEQERAASLIMKMHGPFRIPTLLKYVDKLSRQP